MATLKSVAFKALTNLAISAAMSVLQPQVGGQGGRTFEFVIDPDGPIPFAAGRVGVAGSVIHRDTFGPDLMYYGMPFVLSGAGPITAIESFMADDYPMSFDANGGATTEPYRQELFFRSVLGHQPAPVALSTPSGLKNGATLPGWTAAHKLSGKAAGLIVMAENSKGSAFPTGEIKPLITFRGLKGWDPRQDSTYPGGSGSCRLDDPSTWVYLTNPILWALKWSLGLWEGPTGKGAPQIDHQVGGIGAKLSGIDVPAFVAAANIADANGWTVSAYPNTDDDKHQVLEAFLQAGGAIYSQRAGKISCIQRAAPRTSIVTISAADTAGPLEIDTAASRIDRINTIRPRFWSPSHRWQMTAMDEVTAASYQTEDGGKRTRGIDYPFVSNAKQAGQLAALQIANTREGIAGVIPLKPHLQRIRPGDAFTITEAGFVLNGLKCLCLNTDYDPATGVVRVSFVSETDAKYPFALGQNPTPPTPQVLTPVDPRFVSPPFDIDWTVTPQPPTGAGQLPTFDLRGVVSNDTATSILVELYEVPAGQNPNDTPPVDTGWQQVGVFPPTAETIPVTVQPDRYYWIGWKHIRGTNYSERMIKGPWLSGQLIAGDLSPESPVRIAVTEITDRLQDVEQISAANAAAVADLETVYGDTVSAAESALAAGQAANLAVLKAGEAGDAAAASNVSAGIATTKADEAGQSATAANASKLAAEVARDGASGSAAASATNAAQALAYRDQAGEFASSSSGSANQAGTAAGQALAYRDQSASSAAAANAASISAGVSAQSAADHETGAAAAAASAFQQAANASSSASSASISANLAAKAGAQNEYANADISNGTNGFTPIWGFGGALPTVSVVNGGDAIRAFKAGGTFDGTMTRYGIVALDGGGVSKSAASAPARKMWPVANGERVALAFDGRTRSGSARWAVDFRWCNQSGGNSTSLATFETSHGNTAWQRIGAIRAAPGDGYVWAEATMVLGWDGSAGTADMELRRPTFCRMRSDATELPTFSAPAGGGALADLSANLSITAAVAADAQTRLSTVRFDVTGGAGGDPFQIWARADASGSAAGLIATELSLSNVVGGSVVPALKLADGRAVFGAPVSIIKNGRRTTMGPGFGVGSSLHFWSGPDTIGFGSETVDNGLLGISDTDGFFGGRTINGPFDSGAVSATVITVTTAWTTVATVASKDVGPTGSFLFRADWRATLSPKSPPPEAPAYGLNWRMVSTNLAGGDLRVIATGYADGNAGVTNTIMGVQYRMVEGHSSPRAPRRLLLQLAMSGADDTQAASAHSARLQGVYYQT